MKSSYFNLLFQYNKEGDCLLYNTIESSLIKIEKRKVAKTKELLKYGTSNDQLAVELFTRLGYLIPNRKDELCELSIRNLNARYNNRKLLITVLPTFACNLKCIYCFEGTLKKYIDMNKCVQNKIFELVKALAPYNDKVHVAWFGGEPLLRFDIVSSLSKKLIELCKKENVEYSSNLVTNGTLLSKDIVKELIKYKFNHIQVTIDGDKDIHNERRPFNKNMRSFQPIFKNLQLLLTMVKNDNNFKITLRTNIDKNNVEHIIPILKKLKSIDLHDKLKIKISKVTETPAYNLPCLKTTHFVKHKLELLDQINDLGFKNNSVSLPKQIQVGCSAEISTSFVIGPTGELYKCTRDVGIQANIIGNIKDFDIKLGVGEKNPEYCYKYLLFDATKNKKCKNCKLLPICFGGCAKKRIDNNGIPVCDEIKYSLKKILQKYAKEKLGA
jgi:uncharacterized protein